MEQNKPASGNKPPRITCIACARERSQSKAAKIPICHACWDDLNDMKPVHRIQLIAKLHEANAKTETRDDLREILWNLRKVTGLSANPLEEIYRSSGN